MKRNLIYICILIVLFACTTINIRDKDTFGRIIFKNIKNKSEKIQDSHITGMFRVSGVEDIPSAFLKFESYCFFKEKKVFFRVFFINNLLIDIIFDKNNALFINHIGKEFVEYNIEQVDFSKFTGANFNPLDIGYFFLGCIPYSENMEIIDFKLDKKDYIMVITDNISKYTIHLNSNEEISKVEIFNQYFDNLYLDSITYNDSKKNNIKIPYKFDFLTEKRDIKIQFILNDIANDLSQFKLNNFAVPDDYKKVSSIEKIKIDFKERNKK